MAPEIAAGWPRVHEEYCKLYYSKENMSAKLHYIGGASLTPSDLLALNVGLSPIANSDFWKPASHDTEIYMQNALESYLKEHYEDLESYLNDNLICKTELAECSYPTINYAHNASDSCIRPLLGLLSEGILDNEALTEAFGYSPFQGLGIAYIRSDSWMETQKGFSTPEYPHVTLLSMQPQRAQNREELLCTEVWTLYYWVLKLLRRALHTTNHCLPMRLVSLCGYEARVISTVFDLGRRPSVVKDMGHREGRKIKTQIHIGEYRDLSNAPQFLDLMKELLAMPCGNAEVQQHKT